MEFMGMGTMEIVVILLIALAVFGPNRLVEIARKLGRFVREISKVGSEFSKTLSEENLPKEEKQTIHDLKIIGSEVRQTLTQAAQSVEGASSDDQSPAGSVPVPSDAAQQPAPSPPAAPPLSQGQQTLSIVPKEPTESKPS